MRSVASLLFVLLLSAFCGAQSGDRVDVFGGFSYVRPDFTGIGPGGPGWNIAGSVKVVRFLRAVGDFSGFYPTGSDGANAHYHMFLGGPEVAVRVGTYRPFAHFLLGATTGNLTYAGSQGGGDFSDFTAGAGGGVDIGSHRFAFRAQADWLHITRQFSPSNDVARISTGLVVRF